MQIVKIPIGEITPYADNARTHAPEQVEQIAQSIRLYGNNDPIAVWGEDNTIVEGHGRYQALRELGYKEVDCIRLDSLTDKERREYALVHNQLTDNSQWDFDALGDALADLDFGGFDFDFPNLDDLEDAGDASDAGDAPDASDADGGMIADANAGGAGAREYDAGEFADSQFSCRCPRCGFMFNPSPATSPNFGDAEDAD